MESSRSLAGHLTGFTQFFQQFFAGASDFSISGGQFTAVGGDYYVDKRVTTVTTIQNGMDRAELEQILAQVCRQASANKGIKQQLGYTGANGITIIDAFGASFVLPKEMVQRHSDVHDAMLKYFRGKLGETRVVKQRYCITRERDGTLVKPEDWEMVVNAGEAVVMSMLIERVWSESVQETCPQCGRTRLGTYKENGRWICRRCNKHFTFVSRPKWRPYGGPPARDEGIVSFKHVRNIFLKQDVYDNYVYQEWDEAERDEENRFEEVFD